MIRRQYAMDAQNRAEDLAVTILSASSPPQIAAAARAAASFLRRHAADQSRAFFSVAFPALICRLFGFDDPPAAAAAAASPASSSPAASTSRSSGWIDCAVADAELARDLFDLLSPNGVLFSSIDAVDRSSLVRYVFPIERLPEWMRIALQGGCPAAVLSDLCPLLRSGIEEDKANRCFQLQLGVFEYFVFWFAYFPVCRGRTANLDPSHGAAKSRIFALENWASPLQALASTGRRSGRKTECNLYLRLLYAYLHAFANKSASESHQPYRSSLLHYSSAYDGSTFTHAEFFVNTLVHFWMVDNDFSPFSASLCKSFGVPSPLRRVLIDVPPTPGLGEVLRLVVKYLNSSSLCAPSGGNDYAVQLGTPASETSFGKLQSSSGSGIHVGSWNSVMRRPLYRSILRTFLFCPIGTCFKNASEVVELWMTYMTPWKTCMEDFAEFESPIRSHGSSGSKSITSQRKTEREFGYNSSWQGYVLASYLFYSSMFVHFLEFAHKFLHADVDAVIPLVLKVLEVLTSSKDLVYLLRQVDTVYHSKPIASSLSDNIRKYVPSIREQLQDWEDGLFDSGSTGVVFSHENRNANLRLFSDGEDGAHSLLQLLVLRAEHEIEAVPGDASQRRLHALDTIKSHMDTLFVGHVTKLRSPVSAERTPCLRRGGGDVFTPKHPKMASRKRSPAAAPGAAGYKGDWMKRPISDHEVAWLARLLIWLSDWLNEVLGLDRADAVGAPVRLEVNRPTEELVWEGGPKEALSKLAGFVCSCLVMSAGAMIGLMRAYKVRINLRGLASKRLVMFLLVMFLLVCVLFASLKWVWLLS